MASTIGNIAGNLLPGSLAEKGVSVAARPLLAKLGTSVAANIARPVITGAISQGALSAINDAILKQNPKTVAKNAAFNAAAGGAFGAAGAALHNVPLIRSAVKEAGIKRLVIPEEKLGSGLARSAETRAVENANRLMPESNRAIDVNRFTAALRGNTAVIKSALAAENVKIGNAIYHAPDGDIPVNVTKVAGEKGGVRYYNIEGSKTVIPENQVEFSKSSAKFNSDSIGKSAADIKTSQRVNDYVDNSLNWAKNTSLPKQEDHIIYARPAPKLIND